MCIRDRGIITLNRPKSLNAMNADLVEEFHRALDIFVEDEDVRVIILTLSLIHI